MFTIDVKVAAGDLSKPLQVVARVDDGEWKVIGEVQKVEMIYGSDMVKASPDWVVQKPRYFHDVRRAVKYLVNLMDV